MNDYEENIKIEVSAALFRIGLLIVLPLYLAFNFFDWITFPAKGFLLLGIRLAILPVVLLCAAALNRHWPGRWYAYTVWLCGLAASLQMIVMASLTGNLSGSVYIHSVNLVATLFVFLFTLRLRDNLITLIAIYLPPAIFLGLELQQSGNLAAAASTLSLYAAMIVTLGAAAWAIERLRAKHFQQKANLFYMATTDALSGLKLRRYFFNRFIQELSLRLRKNSKLVLSLILIDIDKFKQINDTHGHDAGDRAIRHIGELIRSNIRIYDVACRFGGEEFVILLPETRLEEAKIVSERIRKTLENSPISIGGKEIPFTLSAGISGSDCLVTEDIRAVFMDPNHRFFLIKHMTQMIKEADEALYESKKQGRNRVSAGKSLGFSLELNEEEITVLRSYLPYFEQSLFVLQSESKDSISQEDLDFNFYPPEYFFRRCVEGLYRWYRDPEWREVLAVISIQHSNSEIIKRQFPKIFRLADAISVLGKGTYGVIFYGMPEAALEKILERIKKQLAQAGLPCLRVTIAAAMLRFEGEREKLKHSMSYGDFSKRTTEIFRILKTHRFPPQEDIFYHE